MSVSTSRNLLTGVAGAIARLLVALGMVLAAGVTAGDDSSGAGSTTYPSSIDALGASTTAGYNTCPEPWTDCPDNSWATGANPAVNSVYRRLLALNPRLEGNNGNDAASGTAMADLAGQVQGAVARGAELVTIAMGTNDACGGRTGVMTEVSAFRDEFRQAMATLTTGLPEARVHVVSIPDLYRRWAVFHTDRQAVKAWRALPFCPTLLARPTSNAPVDVARRLAVRDRVDELNVVLAEVCAEYTQCATDGGAVFEAPVVRGELSPTDYWHPSVAGQAAMAEQVWQTLGY